MGAHPHAWDQNLGSHACTTSIPLTEPSSQPCLSIAAHNLSPFLLSLSLAWEGRIVVLGFTAGKIASLPTNLLLLKNISALGLYWGRYQQQDFALFSKSMSSALQYCQQGLIHPHVGAVFKLEKVRQHVRNVGQIRLGNNLCQIWQPSL